MNIINGNNISDDHCLEHMLLVRSDLLKYLGIQGKIPKGYSIDHIKELKTCVTDDDFGSINHYTSLRLLPVSDNIARNFNI